MPAHDVRPLPRDAHRVEGAEEHGEIFKTMRDNFSGPLKKLIPTVYANEMFQTMGRSETLRGIQQYEPVALSNEVLAAIQEEMVNEKVNVTARSHVDSIYAGAIGAAILAIQLPIIELAFWLIDGSAEVERYARQYFLIRVWSMPAVLGTYAIIGWYYGLDGNHGSNIDLVAVLLHEMGHVLGREHDEGDDLMNALLRPGERHALEVDAAFGDW